MRDSLFVSTPVRVTAILGAVFALAMLVAGLVAWQLVDRELAGRLDDSIREEFAVISQTYGDSDITDLADSVKSHVTATVGQSHIYLLRDTSGQILAGNVPRAQVPLGWSLVDGSAIGLNGDGRYRVFSSAVEGNALLVGASLRETEAVGSIVLTSLAVGAVLLMIIVAGLGAVLAFRGQRRLDEIAQVMQSVGQGQLDARLPTSRRRDDIDRVATQVNDALARLAALVESMRQVSVDIAHDLKTPLNRLAIAVFEAASSAEGSEVEQKLIEAEQEIDQINATFDALLRIAQIESGSRKARFESVALRPPLADLAYIYAGVAEDRGQSLKVDLPNDLGSVPGDRELLTQLFANLIENAIRHCQDGAHIGLTAKRDGGCISVEVSDDGPGIPESEREAVFRRLYRIERSRTTPGTGLGLSLVKAIADLHDATVSLADNAPGLRVTVTFPNPA